MPCSRARARELLNTGKGAVYRLHPFTIILKERTGGESQDVELKIDPGSKETGVALVGHFKRGSVVIWAATLSHRGTLIKKELDARRALRRSRRNRKTRYRKPRFNNRTRAAGWLPPSLQSRVDNVYFLVKKCQRSVPISSIAVETVRFDTQKLENPEVSGCEYQKGTLFGYEIREYLLEKWGRLCAYCDAKQVRLEIDHIVPKSRGGSDRVSNLIISCRSCNEKKGNQYIEKFLVSKPKRLAKILKQCKISFKDAAAVNAARYAIGNALKSLGLPVTFWSGGRTKFNRTSQGYSKDHWIDAACVGESGFLVRIPRTLITLAVIATGRGSRQQCLMDRFGFPRTKPKSNKRVMGFQTGDLVAATVTKGKKAGNYSGRIAVRSSGNFSLKTKDRTVDGIHSRYCRLLQQCDGYMYNNLQTGGGVSSRA